MQLFISSQFVLKEHLVSIQDERIIYQCHKVLRCKSWSIIQLQDWDKRYTLELTACTSKNLEGFILTQEDLPDVDSQVSLAIALPNRRDKAEVIVQKLSELGVQEIIFWPAQRSILRSIPSKKLERLEKIALEAAEQSFRNTLVSIKFLDKLDKKTILWQDQIFLAEKEWTKFKEIGKIPSSQKLLAIIGPEWWLNDQEKMLFKDFSIPLSLWNTMLRMETAAIVMGRILCNH